MNTNKAIDNITYNIYFIVQLFGNEGLIKETKIRVPERLAIKCELLYNFLEDVDISTLEYDVFLVQRENIVILDTYTHYMKKVEFVYKTYDFDRFEIFKNIDIWKLILELSDMDDALENHKPIHYTELHDKYDFIDLAKRVRVSNNNWKQHKFIKSLLNTGNINRIEWDTVMGTIYILRILNYEYLLNFFNYMVSHLFKGRSSFVVRRTGTFNWSDEDCVRIDANNMTLKECMGIHGLYDVKKVDEVLSLGLTPLMIKKYQNIADALRRIYDRKLHEIHKNITENRTNERNLKELFERNRFVL